MRILILGGHGFIGSQVSKKLKELGHTVGVVDCYHQYYTFPNWEYFPILQLRKNIANNDETFVGKIEDEIFMEKTFFQFKPQRVIHLGTYPNAKIVQNYISDATGNMITATANILNLCVKHAVEKIIFSSSSMVYGDFKDAIPNETVVPSPNTLYGSYKYQGELMCKIWRREHGLNYIIMRPSALYGTPDIIVRVISQLVKSSLTTGQMTVQGPDNKLDFSNVLDVAEYFVRATLSDVVDEIFNCTKGYGRRIIEAAEIIKQKIGDIKINIRPHDNFYPNRDTLNSDKAKEILKFQPTIDIEQGIPEYIDWFCDQKFYKDNLNF
jgi:UDP-glucose 4-epimerase